MKVLIVDNEPALQEMLQFMLVTFCPEVKTVHSAGSIEEAKVVLKYQSIDLLFLDVELNEGTGFDLLRQIEVRNFQVIFITAHNQYAIDAFRYSAIDYLLKPFEVELLIKSVQKAAHNLKNQQLSSQVDFLLNRLGQKHQEQSRRIALKDAERIHYLRSGEISFCEAAGTYTRFFLEDGRCITVSKNLKEFAQILEPLGFIRTHNSYLVNQEKVLRFEKNAESLILENNQSVPLSHRKREIVLRQLEQLR
jgi:two-component system LytT family response regulator